MKCTAYLHRFIAGAALALACLPASADDNLVRRGEYLARAGDCVACHTAPGGKTMAGGLPLGSPIGPIISTNITPSKTHGIGNYSLAQFTDAVRKGIRADGKHLYPAMPYTSYALVSDDDIKALYAYFMQGVQPVDAAPAKQTELPFPFNIRLSMAAWNLLFLNSKPFQPDPGKSADWNRGAYLVRGLAHCGACHSPRNMLMAEQTSRALAGGELEGWLASNITSDANSGVGGWQQKELIDYLRLGHTADKGPAAGPMADAVDNSLRYLSEDDLRAIAAYLKSVPPQRDEMDTKPVYAWGGPADELSSIRGVALPQNPDRMSGPQLYDAYCASCHQSRGQGTGSTGLPPLFHNTTVGRSDTGNLVMVMLHGIQRAPDVPDSMMPGFAHELSDVQVATLGNYLTQLYGNPKAKVTAEQVKNLRAGGASSTDLVLLARIGLAVAAVVIIALILALMRRKRRTAR